MTDPTLNFGHLILTLNCSAGTGDAITLMAHTPNGPVPVYIQAAEPKGCRCGSGTKRVKMRIVAPRQVKISRVDQEEMPQ
jgi:hypothetical protein